MDGDASRCSVKASNFLPFDFLTALGSEGVKFLAFKVSPDFDWAESLQGAKLHISQEGEVSLEAPRCKEELGIRPSESEWSQLLCLAPPKQGLAKLKICGRVDAVLQLHRTSKMLSAADSAARITHEELSRQQDAGNKAKRGQRKAEAKRRAETRSRCQLPSLSDALCGVAWDFGRELEPIYREDAWDGSGHAPEVVRRESTVSKGIPAEMLGLKLKMKVVELEAGQSLKVAFWSMGNFCLDGLESVTFTSYQLERPGAKGKTRLQLTGKASDSPGLHVLGHPAKVFPPFDDLTLIAVHLPESRELQICPCALFNIEIDRQGKGYSDPKDPVNLNREEEPVPEEDTGPMTAKQYRDKRKLAIESFGTAKKMRSFGQVAERLDRDLEVANLEQYTGSISARVEEQLKLKQTAEEKDEETKREVLPPFIRSDDPQKIYVDGLQSIVSDEALENEESLPAEGILGLVASKKGNEVVGLGEMKGKEICGSALAFAVLKARHTQGAGPAENPKMFAKKLGVLNWLIILCNKDWRKKNIVTSKNCATFLGFGNVEPSDAVKQLFKYCFDPTVGGRGKRTFNQRKGLCAAIIWALHLTPGLWIDVTSQGAAELTSEKNVQTAGRYIGCKVEPKKETDGTSSLRVILKGPPNFDERAAAKGVGRGARKKR